ncbi:MAG: hypothetical protein IIB55_03135, partial [Planctomycetes bacterium]|nr:hypothetical protein [Planctomycetota bacterium]
EAVQTAARLADEEIAHSEIPPEFEDAVKQYFGRLEKRAKDDGSSQAPDR